MRFGEMVDLNIAPSMTIENGLGNSWFFAVNDTSIVEEAIIQDIQHKEKDSRYVIAGIYGATWQYGNICNLFINPLLSTIKRNIE